MRSKSLDRAALIAICAMAAGIAPAAVTWDFESNANSSLGGAPTFYNGTNGPAASDTAPVPTFVANGGGTAYQIQITHNTPGGYSGVNFTIKPGGTAYNAVNATFIDFDAKRAAPTDIATWSIAFLNNSGYSATGGDTVTLTDSLQHFHMPITTNMRANGAFGGTPDDVATLTKVIFSPQDGGNATLIIDNLTIDGAEGSTYVPPALTHFDANFDNGTSVTESAAGATPLTGGQVVVDSGGDGGTPGGQISGLVTGGKLATSGSFVSGATANYYYITISNPFQVAGQTVNLTGNVASGFGIEYTASKNGSDTTGNWFIRIEDGGPDYQNFHPQLILDGAPHVLPIGLFTAGGTDPATAAAVQGTRAPDLTVAKGIVVFTEYASQPAGFQNGTSNLHNYTEMTTLQLDRVRLVNGAGVNDWSLY